MAAVEPRSVEILIANYNNGRYFIDCYKSIRSQSYPNVSILIVDDASTDNSVQIISECIKDDRQARLIQLNENRGVGFCKARLLENATGDLVGFVDPDDVLTGDIISHLVNFLTVDKELVAAFSAYEICDENLEQCLLRPNFPFGKRPVLSYWEYGVGSANPFYLLRRSAYQPTQGIDPTLRMAEDIDFYLKIDELGPIYHTDFVGYKVRRHAESLTADVKLVAYWFWVLQALYAAGERRIQDGKYRYCDYVNKILSQYVFYLRDCIEKKDRDTYLRIKNDIGRHRLHRKPLFYFLYVRYFIRFYQIMNYRF